MTMAKSRASSRPMRSLHLSFQNPLRPIAIVPKLRGEDPNPCFQTEPCPPLAKKGLSAEQFLRICPSLAKRNNFLESLTCSPQEDISSPTKIQNLAYGWVVSNYFLFDLSFPITNKLYIDRSVMPVL